MTITDEQEEKLTNIMNVVSENKQHLNAWELKFYEDQEKRYAEHGVKISLSPKQMAVLDKLYEKCTEV